MSLLRSRKHQSPTALTGSVTTTASRPERAEFVITLMFVRAGELGNDLGFATFSTYGESQIHAVAETVREGSQGELVAVVCSLLGSFQVRQIKTAQIIAADLGNDVIYVDSKELIQFIGSQKWAGTNRMRPMATAFDHRIRQLAEDGITTIVIVAALPLIEDFFPGEIIDEGSCHQVKFTSMRRNIGLGRHPA